MYDTSIPLEKCYIALMTRWTAQLTESLRSTECGLLLGIPSPEMFRPPALPHWPRDSADESVQRK